MGRRDHVIVQFGGRLGNQLFEFATGYAVARRCGGELLFYDPQRELDNPGNIQEILRHKLRSASHSELLRLGVYSFPTPLQWSINDALGQGMLRLSKYTKQKHRIVPPQLKPWDFIDAITGVTPPVLLNGLFQSERYFDHLGADIANNLILPDVAIPAHLKRPFVSVHFRRGVHVTARAILPLAYYENALRTLAHDNLIGTLLVFSDDAEFAKLVVPWLEQHGSVVTGASLAAGSLQELSLIVKCDHHVISNSTFSWWGAWLSEQLTPLPDRIVCAPSKWVDGKTDDIIPPRWTKVSRVEEKTSQSDG